MKNTMARIFLGVLVAVALATVSVAAFSPQTYVAATATAWMTSLPNVDTGGPSSE